MSGPRTPTISRPHTPNGLSPRGSYTNLSAALDASTPGSSTPALMAEKERMRAEAEVREALLKAADGAEKAKKEETGMPAGSPVWPILSYCVASIMMTVVNKFVVSGHQFTMTFLLLTIQSAVCVACVWTVKRIGFISFRDFDMNDAKTWFPVSFLLVAVIYTGSKSLQFLSIPVYTIFKNLTIILIAYGEVLWFGGNVTGLTLVSFFLMVGSSIIAAWSDISSTLARLSAGVAVLDPTSGADVPLPSGVMGSLNAGYVWMFINCVASAAYVLFMRKRIKVTGFKDWDSMFYNNLLSIPVLLIFSLIVEDWGSASFARNFPEVGRTFLLSAIAFSGAVAVFISYSTAWCVRTCGSTTYSMVGALNKLPVAASGILFFGDPANLGNVSAIGVGGIAGVVYAVAKTNQAKIEKAKQARSGDSKA
ncbi:GDP-mannose transporter 2 [Kwoniella mangroviensis CBS 8507]|uniref:GDP-mannose transporter 2 n=1 Tax=Kwoniella mangroviensis CBS 8507 TaxID=1296122 RepID=UPI00080D60AE|nr:GDP-mannose transporter 2 [Kwoniella mangroviensis CBS 8507]OCF69950.1 GDP-mannose transporter 2 [Kwoniella mangroviensis CBS 8507]